MWTIIKFVGRRRQKIKGVSKRERNAERNNKQRKNT